MKGKIATMKNHEDNDIFPPPPGYAEKEDDDEKIPKRQVKRIAKNYRMYASWMEE